MPKYTYVSKKLTAAEIAARAGLSPDGLVVERDIDDDGNPTMTIATTSAIGAGAKTELDKIIGVEIGKR